MLFALENENLTMRTRVHEFRMKSGLWLPCSSLSYLESSSGLLRLSTSTNGGWQKKSNLSIILLILALETHTHRK